jgi:hypothetical protein
MPLVAGDASSRREVRRIWAVVLSLVYLVVGIWGLARDIKTRQQSDDSVHWAGASGVITTSIRRHQDSGRYRSACTWAEICFRYSVAGNPETSCRPTFGRICDGPTAEGLLTHTRSGPR